MSEAATPPGGGNMKMVIAGVVLLLGSLALFLMTQSSPEPKADKPESTPVPEQVERANPLADQNLILDDLEEEPDAGAPQAEPEAPIEVPKKAARRVRPSRDKWDCAGDMDRGGLQKVLGQNRAQVRACYERRLKVDNLLQGDLRLKIKIGDDGKVAATAISGSLRDKEVSACVRKLAREWIFPKPAGGSCAVVQVPFQFSPKN